MAGTKALNVRMNFQVDTTQARQQIQQLGAQLNSITKASNFSANSSLGITSQILEATKAAAQLKTALTEAINPLTGNLNLSAFNDQLIASKMSLMDYRNQLSALGTTGNQAFNSLARSIMTAETPLIRAGKTAQQMWTVLGNTVRWQATSSMIHGIMSTASQAMNYVKSLDSSLNSIRIVTGQSQAQMEKFAQTANKAAKELNTSTNAYAKASLIYYQQGLSNEEVEKRAATTVKLANVSGQTAAKVSDQLTAIWNNFYDGSKSLEYYADVMTALGASTASSTDEIAKGLEKFSSIAKTTGLSYEYATSALSTVVAATRQSADSVGTSFKTLFSRLQGLSLGETLDDGTTLNKYSKALEVIGVNIKNANGSLKDMDDILDEIGARWTSLSKAEQVALAQTVGGARNYTGLVSLMDNWNDFQTNLRTAQQAQGTLQNQADIYAQSWEAASNHVRVASETIYKNLLDDKFFKGMTNMFGYILDGIGEVTNQMGGFKGVMAGLANFAFTTFTPQISKSFASIGSTIYGMTPQGQQKVLDLRTQAMNAISDKSNFSQYMQVNNLQQQYGQAFNKRQVAYDNLVLKGKINDYEKSAYQMLFSAADLQNEQAIVATEKAFQSTDIAELERMRGQQRFNYQLNQRNIADLKKNYDKFLTDNNLDKAGMDKFLQYKRAYQQAQDQSLNSWDRGRAQGLLAANQRNGAWANFTPAMINQYEQMANNFNYVPSQQRIFATDIKNYGDLLFKESIAANIRTRLGAGAEGGIISKEEAARTASYIARTVEGAKGYGEALGSQFTVLKDVNAEINKQTELYNKGQLSQEQYNEALANIFKDNTQLMTWLDQTLSSADGSGAIQEKLIDQVYNANKDQGMTRQQAEAQVSSILTAQNMKISDKLAAIDKIGGAGTANAAIAKMLEDQAKSQQTISMSSALATNMGALASLGQIYNSVGTAIKTFGDENATAGQQVASLTSLAMAGSMAIKPFGNFVKTAGEQVTIFGKSLGITNGVFGIAMAGVAALAVATSAAVKEWNASHNLGKIIDGYSESIAISTQKASEAQSAYENLLTQKNTHNNLTEELQTLQAGTLEFNNALLQANLNAQDLINTYELIYGEDYTYGENGLPEFNNEQLDKKVKEKQQESIDASYNTQILSNIKSLVSNYEKQLNASGINAIVDATEGKILTDINQQLNLTWTTTTLEELGRMYEGRLASEWDLNFEQWYDKQISDYMDRTSALDDYHYRTDSNINKEEVEYADWIENTRNTIISQSQAQLEQAVPGKSFNEIANLITALQQIGQDTDLTEVEKIAKKAELLSDSSEYLLTQQAHTQAIIAAELSKNQDLNQAQREMIALEASSIYDHTQITQAGLIAHQLGTSGWFEKVFTGHDINEVYQALYGESAKTKNLSDSEIRNAIETEFFSLFLSDTQTLNNKLGNVGLSLENFGFKNITNNDLSQITDVFKNLNLPNLTNLSEEDIEKSYQALMTFERTLGFVNEEEAKEYATSTGLPYQAAKVNYGGGILSYTDPKTGKRIDNSETVFVSKYSGKILTQDQVEGLREAGRLSIDAEAQKRPGWLGGLETVYTPEQIQSIWDSAELAENWVDGFEITTSLDPEKNKIIKKYQDYAIQLYNNQRNELAEALYVNFSDGLLDGNKLKEQGSPFYDTISSLAGSFVKETENSIQYVYKSLTYGALKDATNAIINANAVGENVATELTKQMILGRTRDGNFDTDTLAVMRNYNYENSISAMYANSRLQKNAPDAQRDKYIKLFSAQIEDIDREKGWFQMLYNSSGFSDVLEKIQDQFNTSGQISAEYITKLADKSEILSQFLQVSADSAGLLNVNAGGLASVFEELSKGTISTSDINSTLMSAMSTGSSRSAANAAAFEVVDNLDLGRSGLDFLDYFQDMAKQMYQSKKAGWGFYTDPIQNIIDLIGGPEVRAAYNEANSHADWNFKQMWDFMSSDSRSSGFMEFMDSMAGKKGKGGGGPADVMSYLYDVLKNTGVELNDDLWNQLGFRVNEKGSFWLREKEDGSQEFTQDQLVDNLTKFLVEHGWDEESARSMAQVQMGTASTSGQVGYALDYRAASQSYDQMLRSNTPMSEQQRRAWFNQYGALITKPDGTKYKDFEDFDANYTGNKGWAAANKSDWSRITNVNDLVNKAKEVGTTFIDSDGTIHNVGEASTLGEQGQFNQLAQAYNAAIIGQHGEVTGYDYDKLVEMIEAMNGTEADLQRILEENENDFKGKIYGKNAYGREIKFDGDEFKHLSDFVTELNKPKAQEQMMYNNLTTQGSVDVFQGMQQLYWENPETGEVVLDPYGTRRNEYQKQLEANSAELRERASNAQTNADLVEHYGGTEEQKQNAQKAADTASYAADLYDYQHLMSATERQAYLDEARKQYAEDPNKMTPFQKSLLSIVDDINTGVADQLEIAEETENGGEKGKGKTHLNEEGELVDEEGNPIEMPEGQQPSGNGGNGRDSGRDTGTGGGPGKGPSGSNNELPKLHMNSEGRFFDDNHNEYVQGPGGQVIVIENPDTPAQAGQSGNTSAVSCFAAGTQILMADKTIKNIENVQIDEIVISYDEEKQQFVPKKVIRFDAHTDTSIIVKLTFDNGNILKLTPSHPLLSTFGWKSLDIENALRVHGVLTTLLQIGDIILGFEKEASVINIEYLTDQLQYNTYNIDIEDCHTYLANGFIAHNKAASGQNNARLLAYASGKEGHIAVTGELGPELRVKSDGSMDILGKKGREYAWVEPGDRIYTASQSAGILKSNKIPGLEGLAKGINNYIPGYEIGADWNNSGSSGGGGGGGGGRSHGGGGAAAEKEDDRYDPKTLKIRDVLERYYTILQQIDNITKAVERFSKVADRAWGRERIRAIEHQNELQQKQYEAQKKYIAEIEEYLDVDQSTLTNMVREFVTEWNEKADKDEKMEKLDFSGAEYDENGVLTNYRDIVEKLVEQYNQKAASANQKDQYKFQERLKDIQMWTDSLNLYEEQVDALEDIKNAILDTAVKVISYEVEYKLELSGDADRILNFQADKYKDDVYQAAKYLELLDQRADLTRQNLETVTEGIMKTLGTYAGENMRVGIQHSLDELDIHDLSKFEIPEELLEELDEDDESDKKKLEELKKNQQRDITRQIGIWLDEARALHPDDVAEIEKILDFGKNDKKKQGEFTYDYDWQDEYSSWIDYYENVINNTKDGSERFIENYEEIVKRLNSLADYDIIRETVDGWLEELRAKDAEAAAEVDKIVRRDANGQLLNYSDVIERLNEENVKLNDEFINLLYTDQDAFFKAMNDFKNNPGWVDFTTEHKDLLTNYMDQIYQYLGSLQDTYEQTIEQLGDSIKATAKQMDSAIDEFDYYGDVYKTFGNIVDLTNRQMTDVSQEFFDTLNNKSMDNSINKIKATVTNYHLLQKELAEVTRQYNVMQARADAATGEEQIYLQQSADKLKEQLDIANSQYEDAHKAFLSSWEDALSKMSENYKKTIEEASKNFEKGFSPLFNTLALLQAQFDREKALGDLYVDNYQRIHDLNKLNRDIESSIIDTDNLQGKERLRDLQKEINDLQEDGTELSEYDLDILDKKYKLELARQALEDAKDAKSMVRLARDNNGNWSYVYTADQDEVDKAEQDYEDAIREMEQANEDYIDSIQEQIVQVQQEAQQAILALQPEDFATYDDYLAAVNNIQNSMYQTLDFLRSQLNNAFGNNDWLDPYIVNRYGINDHNLRNDFGDTTLAALLNSDNLDDTINKAKDNLTNNMIRPALEAFTEYSIRQREVYEAAEHDIGSISEDFENEMNFVAQMSNNEVQIVEKLSDRIQTAFEEMSDVVDEKTAKHIAEVDDLISKYETLVEAITEVKRISGENLPVEGTEFAGRVDSWADIQRLEKLLHDNGEIRILEDLVGYDTEKITTLEARAKEATPIIKDWMEQLLTDKVDQETKDNINNMIRTDEEGNILNYREVAAALASVKKTKDNKKLLKEIKKWREKDEEYTVVDPESQLLKEGEGLWTQLIAGSDFTKEFLQRAKDEIMYRQKVDVGKDVDETEKATIEAYLKSHGGVWVKWDEGEKYFDSLSAWREWYEKHKHVESSGGGGGTDRHTPSNEEIYNSRQTLIQTGHYDTGGYTGHWQSADTGMYTGEWPSGSVRRNGRLAWLHQKELVLNAHDTENFLDAMEIVRQLDNLTNWMANGLGDLAMPRITTETGELEQNVHIEAEFPNVTDHNEIEQAFNNLVNMASQYANRK